MAASVFAATLGRRVCKSGRLARSLVGLSVCNAIVVHVRVVRRYCRSTLAWLFCANLDSSAYLPVGRCLKSYCSEFLQTRRVLSAASVLRSCLMSALSPEKGKRI